MKKLLVTMTLCLSGLVFADSAQNFENDFYDIKKIEVFEVSTDNNLVMLRNYDSRELENYTQVQYRKNIGQTLMVARDLIAFGKEIYKIIEAGKPVVNIGEVTPVSVLPRGENGVQIDTFDLEGWKMPKSKKFKVVAKNAFGMTMVSFEFMLLFTYGGKYNGKGAYLTGAEITATDVEVGWGYNLDANFKVQSMTNQGTRENPIAAAVLQISYKMKTLVKETQSTKKFMINGQGAIRAY